MSATPKISETQAQWLAMKAKASQKSTGVADLPLELLEKIADYVAINSVEGVDNSGPRFVNPITRTSPKQNLIAFASTCKTFRIAALRHLPELSRDITLFAFSELERIRDEAPLRHRLAPHVRHITLAFSVPLQVSFERLKRALIILCVHPSLDNPSLPHLEGVSFSSTFLSSYSAHANVRRDWQQVAREEMGLTGWQATLVGGMAKFSTMLAGGQSMMERFGDAECLFLKWNDRAGETWSQGHDMVFRNHYAPPLALNTLPNAPYKLLITPFMPTAPKQPPLFAHPTYHASYFLLSSMIKTSKSAVSTPLRQYAAMNERVQHASELREWDQERSIEGYRPGQMLYDERGTVMMASVLVEKICFIIPEPSLIDSLEDDDRTNRVIRERRSSMGELLAPSLLGPSANTSPQRNPGEYRGVGSAAFGNRRGSLI